MFMSRWFHAVVGAVMALLILQLGAIGQFDVLQVLGALIMLAMVLVMRLCASPGRILVRLFLLLWLVAIVATLGPEIAGQRYL